MTLTARTYRAEILEKANGAWATLRLAAATKLQPFSHHAAGGGSVYVMIGDTKIRFADHRNTSQWQDAPDYNIVNGKLSEQDIAEIVASVEYPRLCKKTAFAKHVGLTVPKLKKLLTPECYESVVLDPFYPNTKTEFVVVRHALAAVEAAGVTERLPVEQFSASMEDYSGR